DSVLARKHKAAEGPQLPDTALLMWSSKIRQTRAEARDYIKGRAALRARRFQPQVQAGLRHEGHNFCPPLPYKIAKLLRAAIRWRLRQPLWRQVRTQPQHDDGTTDTPVPFRRVLNVGCQSRHRFRYGGRPMQRLKRLPERWGGFVREIC